MWSRAIFVLLCLTGSIAPAASFDCSKTKRKIEKRICADVAVSQLDDQAAQIYAKAFAGASLHHQQELIAERAKFRRERGRYDASASALADDYQRWLGYLAHPQRSRLGSYQGRDDAYVRLLSVQTATGAHLMAQGAGVRGEGGWVSAAPFTINGDTVEIALRRASFPNQPDCPVTLAFEGEHLRFNAQGSCAVEAISGVFRKTIPNLPIWVMPKGSVPPP